MEIERDDDELVSSINSIEINEANQANEEIKISAKDIILIPYNPLNDSANERGTYMD